MLTNEDENDTRVVAVASAAGLFYSTVGVSPVDPYGGLSVFLTHSTVPGSSQSVNAHQSPAEMLKFFSSRDVQRSVPYLLYEKLSLTTHSHCFRNFFYTREREKELSYFAL